LSPRSRSDRSRPAEDWKTNVLCPFSWGPKNRQLALNSSAMGAIPCPPPRSVLRPPTATAARAQPQLPQLIASSPIVTLSAGPCRSMGRAPQLRHMRNDAREPLPKPQSANMHAPQEPTQPALRSVQIPWILQATS